MHNYYLWEDNANMKTVLTKATPGNDITPLESANRALAREAVAEGIVLLANDGALPVAPCPLALFGAGAASTIKGGTGSGEVNERYSVSIEQGLVNAGFSITTDKWLRDYETLLEKKQEEFRKALARKMLTTSADDRINFMAEGFQYPYGRKIAEDDIKASEGACACIYVVARQAGESSDRNLDKFEYHLSQDEIDNLKTAASAFEKTILVINSGAPVDLSPIDEIGGINAVVFFCQQGMEGGNGFADIVTGAVSPSGCLGATWPLKYEDIPCAMEYSYLKGHTEFEEYKESIYIGYRYYDSFGVKPRYEFGYGLSYANFAIGYSDVKLDKTVVTTTVSITNTSSVHSGKKTVQLYVSAPGGKLRREAKGLAAFGKTDVLAPGESQNIDLVFDFREIAGYDESSSSYILEKGDYIISIGESSSKVLSAAVVTLDETVMTEVCSNICPIDRKLDEIVPVPNDTATQPSPMPSISLKMNASDIVTKEHNYDQPKTEADPKTDAVLKKLSLSDMLKVVNGTGIFDSKQFFRVPGAAAHTTSHLLKHGVPDVALCDGPAGLRLQRTSVRYKNGKLKPVDTALRLHDSIPGLVKKSMYGNVEKGTPLYQYASAFPVGTALAQTWNAGLIERIGKAISAEMVEYGVTFWLAPGMNIQRNPLCGRNFEYYSEDPLLTGKVAAAITRGIQSNAGCYATIKHYAANNQETNRNKSNSIMSERTLREIYLKGFRIAVEEGGAKSVMTSYNKINSVYTPNSYDLCTKALRCEWGFDGVVMTDWFSTGETLANNGLAIKAGNDLIMPGGRGYIKMLKKDMKDGRCTIDDLRLCTARVLKSALESRIVKEM